jgi:predicted MFS family arabinose efflux permease
VIVAALAFGVLETAVAWAPGTASAMVLLALTGFASLYFAQAANHRIQLGSDADHRGRVMALYTLILQGSTPLGALLVGWLAQHLGARAALLAGGLMSLAAAVVALILRRRRRPGPVPAPGPAPASTPGPGPEPASTPGPAPASTPTPVPTHEE